MSNLSKKDQDQFDLLMKKKAEGTLKPAEKAELGKLEKQMKSVPVANTFGEKKREEKKVLVSLSQSEIDLLATRADTLIANEHDLIIEKLGNIREISRIKLIRAAVLSLGKMSDKQIINWIKEVQKM